MNATIAWLVALAKSWEVVTGKVAHSTELRVEEAECYVGQAR
jgi:hypothetical protein